jgi:IstB-like ATP binding protein
VQNGGSCTSSDDRASQSVTKPQSQAGGQARVRADLSQVGTAEREQLSYCGFLAELVMAECDDRDKRRAVRRVHDARFPRDERIEEVDFEANSAVSRR